jgi:hypothetical protein
VPWAIVRDTQLVYTRRALEMEDRDASSGYV